MGHKELDTQHTYLKLISSVSFTFFFFGRTKKRFTKGAWVMYLWAVSVWMVVRPQTHRPYLSWTSLTPKLLATEG